MITMPYPGRPRVTDSTLAQMGQGEPEHQRAYVYRDPKRVSPQRLAELEAMDERTAAAERRHGNLGNAPRGAVLQMQAEKQARITAFTRLRHDGMSIEDAAAFVRVSVHTGQRYERARKQAAA